MIRRDPILSRPHRRLLVVALTLALLTALLAGCGSGADSSPRAANPVTANRVIDYAPGTLVIQGSYVDNFGGAHVITATMWDASGGGFTFIFHILEYDNSLDYIVAQNDPANSFNAGLFSRFSWTAVNGNLYYCQDVYDATTALAARSAPLPDNSDLASGCSGFSWTLLGASAWPYFFHPEWALGPPGGTLDTASLGYDKAAGDAAGGSITLGLGTSGDPTARVCAVDGAGDDLAVFENAFPTVDPITMIAGTVSEVAILAVAEDAAGPWYEYPYSIDGGYELIQPQRYSGLAGVTPTAQGGDRFDLTVLIAAHSLAPDFRTCYVRLTDGGTLTTPYDLDDYGNTQTDLHSSGADIDAVAPLHFVEAPGLAQ
jgi:hypothetical protein